MAATIRPDALDRLYSDARTDSDDTVVSEAHEKLLTARDLTVGAHILVKDRPAVVTAVGPAIMRVPHGIRFTYRYLDVVDRYAGCAPGFTNDWGELTLAADAVVAVAS